MSPIDFAQQAARSFSDASDAPIWTQEQEDHRRWWWIGGGVTCVVVLLAIAVIVGVRIASRPAPKEKPQNLAQELGVSADTSKPTNPDPDESSSSSPSTSEPQTEGETAPRTTDRPAVGNAPSRTTTVAPGPVEGSVEEQSGDTYQAESPDDAMRLVALQVITDYCAGGLDGFKRSKWWTDRTAALQVFLPLRASNPTITNVSQLEDSYEVHGSANVLTHNGEWKMSPFSVIFDDEGKYKGLAFKSG